MNAQLQLTMTNSIIKKPVATVPFSQETIDKNNNDDLHDELKRQLEGTGYPVNNQFCQAITLLNPSVIDHIKLNAYMHSILHELPEENQTTNSNDSNGISRFVSVIVENTNSEESESDSKSESKSESKSDSKSDSDSNSESESDSSDSNSDSDSSDSTSKHKPTAFYSLVPRGNLQKHFEGLRLRKLYKQFQKLLDEKKISTGRELLSWETTRRDLYVLSDVIRWTCPYSNMKVTQAQVEMGHFEKMLDLSFDRLRQLFKAESDVRKGNNKHVGCSKLRGGEASSHKVMNDYLTKMRKSSDYSNQRSPRVESVTLMLGLMNSQTVARNHDGYMHPSTHLNSHDLPCFDDWPDPRDDIYPINDSNTLDAGYIRRYLEFAKVFAEESDTQLMSLGYNDEPEIRMTLDKSVQTVQPLPETEDTGNIRPRHVHYIANWNQNLFIPDIDYVLQQRRIRCVILDHDFFQQRELHHKQDYDKTHKYGFDFVTNHLPSLLHYNMLTEDAEIYLPFTPWILLCLYYKSFTGVVNHGFEIRFCDFCKTVDSNDLPKTFDRDEKDFIEKFEKANDKYEMTAKGTTKKLFHADQMNKYWSKKDFKAGLTNASVKRLRKKPKNMQQRQIAEFEKESREFDQFVMDKWDDCWHPVKNKRFGDCKWIKMTPNETKTVSIKHQHQLEIDRMIEKRLSRTRKTSRKHTLQTSPVLILGNASYDNKKYKDSNPVVVPQKDRLFPLSSYKTPFCPEQDEVGLIRRNFLTRYWEFARFWNEHRNKNKSTIVSFAYNEGCTPNLDFTVPILTDDSTGCMLHDHFIGDWNRKTFIHPVLLRGMNEKHRTQPFESIFLDHVCSESNTVDSGDVNETYAKIFNESFFTNFILETACLPGFLNGKSGRVFMPFHPWFLLHLYLFETDFVLNYHVRFLPRKTKFDHVTAQWENLNLCEKLHHWSCSIELGNAVCQLGRDQNYTREAINHVHESYLRDFNGVDMPELSSLQWIVCQRFREDEYVGKIVPPCRTSKPAGDAKPDGDSNVSNNPTTQPKNNSAGRKAKQVAKQKINQCLVDDANIEETAKLSPKTTTTNAETETNTGKKISIAHVTTSGSNNQFELKCSDKLFVDELVDAVVQPNDVTNFSFNFNDNLTMEFQFGLKDGTLNYTTSVQAQGIATQMVDKLGSDQTLEAQHCQSPTDNVKEGQPITPGTINDQKLAKQLSHLKSSEAFGGFSFPSNEISGESNHAKKNRKNPRTKSTTSNSISGENNNKKKRSKKNPRDKKRKK